MKAVALLLVLAGCAERAEEMAPRCTIRPLALSTRDLVTPDTLVAVRHLNAEIRTQCRSQ